MINLRLFAMIIIYYYTGSIREITKYPVLKIYVGYKVNYPRIHKLQKSLFCVNEKRYHSIICRETKEK